MPTNLKCVAFFRFAEGYGWSETHYRLSSSDNPDLLQQATLFGDAIISARASLLGRECATLGGRISYPRAGAVASFPFDRVMQGDASKGAEDEETSLAMLWTDTTNTRRKVTHLRGFWDAVVSNGFYNPGGEGAEGWADRLAAYKGSLAANGYGWLSVDAANSRKGVVTGYVADSNDIVTFTLAAPGLTGIPNDSVIEIRFSRLNGGKSVLNRQLLVKKVSDTSVITVAPIAASGFAGQGRYNYRATTFVPYRDVTTITVGGRRMGKPLRARAGRSQARPRT